MASDLSSIAKDMDFSSEDIQHILDNLDSFKVGRHHRILANMLMAIERGPTDEEGKDRVCVNIPPRHGKSQLVSIYYPAWFLGRNPNKKVMMVSHTTDLAVDFGRKVRNLISTEEFKSIFPEVGWLLYRLDGTKTIYRAVLLAIWSRTNCLTSTKS